VIIILFSVSIIASSNLSRQTKLILLNWSIRSWEVRVNDFESGTFPRTIFDTDFVAEGPVTDVSVATETVVIVAKFRLLFRMCC
jgi:hypothetical protein